MSDIRPHSTTIRCDKSVYEAIKALGEEHGVTVSRLLSASVLMFEKAAPTTRARAIRSAANRAPHENGSAKKRGRHSTLRRQGPSGS